MNKKYKTKIPIVTDNQTYDRASIDFLFNKYGMYGYAYKKGEFKTFEESVSSWIKDQPPPGGWNGFGLDVNDYIKGKLSCVKIDRKKFFEVMNLKRLVDVVISNYNELIVKTTKLKLVKHHSLYDAIEIGLKYFLAKYGCVLKRKSFEAIPFIIQ